MHSTLLAFDIGTSGLKASLVDENLNVIRNVTTTYPTHRYPDGGCEQEAADWWMSAVRAMMMLRELAPEYVKRVDAIGISGHMLGCLPMDRDGQTLRPAMIHADTRALSISNGLRAKFGRDYFYQICGNVLSPASTLCKALWLKENEPEIYARTARILQSKDYLVYRLTGKMDTTDYSDASHGLLMNLQTKQYDAEMFQNVGVDVEKFPEIHASCEIAGRLSEEAAGCQYEYLANYVHNKLWCSPRLMLVEHRGFEPLTSTLRTLRATNCANAPYHLYYTPDLKKINPLLKNLPSPLTNMFRRDIIIKHAINGVCALSPAG